MVPILIVLNETLSQKLKILVNGPLLSLSFIMCAEAVVPTPFIAPKPNKILFLSIDLK